MTDTPPPHVDATPPAPAAPVATAEGPRGPCGPKVAVKLPVIGAPRPARPVAKSKVGKWRAIVLISVHLVFAVHLAYWLGGKDGGVRATLTPVEPSESMATLEVGAVNAGFVFFSLALLSTLVFGRFFCGWGCHVVALQDWCGWGMKKLGVHPKPFRSRLLLWAPLLLALYMFVWPTVRRDVLVPLLGEDINRDGYKATLVTGLQESLLLRDLNGDGRVSRAGEPGDFVPGVSEAAVGRDLNGNGSTADVLPEYAELPLWMGRAAPMPGFKPHFLTEDFWATFAHWSIAIPFLAICGFVTVYFLGAKAFCTYGCPYGGFFAPLDRLSPVRIRVNDNCNGCGHCTAVCTSNVRVHEEVRDYGAVVDPGCMKCLDCISVCPTDALRVGLGAPGLLTRPLDPDSPALAAARSHAQKRYDLSLREELAIAAVFVFFFLGYRGMYSAVPLLMAMGIAMVLAFMVHKSWRLLLDRNVRAPFWQLKRDGRLRPAGVFFLAATAALSALGVQGLATKVAYWKGESIAARLTRTDESWQAAGSRYQPTPRDTADAKAAIAAIKFAGAIGDGGIAFLTSPAQHERLSYLHAYVGENAEAERHLADLVNGTAPKAEWLAPLLAFYAARNAPFEEQAAHLRALEKRWPRNELPTVFLVDLYGGAQRIPEAITIVNEGLQRFPKSAALRERLALGLWARGRPEDVEKAIAAMQIAVENEPTVQRWGMLSQMLQRAGRASEAMAADAKARDLAGQQRSLHGNPGQTTG
ncbi:MAG TPA: 4Fe-4S binding protein, partial [Phycisphaerales bacterium]|nr:4Fe-4S binding protein [Phycisphaerales bacterium]